MVTAIQKTFFVARDGTEFEEKDGAEKYEQALDEIKYFKVSRYSVGYDGVFQINDKEPIIIAVASANSHKDYAGYAAQEFLGPCYVGSKEINSRNVYTAWSLEECEKAEPTITVQDEFSLQIFPSGIRAKPDVRFKKL